MTVLASDPLTIAAAIIAILIAIALAAATHATSYYFPEIDDWDQDPPEPPNLPQNPTQNGRTP